MLGDTSMYAITSVRQWSALPTAELKTPLTVVCISMQLKGLQPCAASTLTITASHASQAWCDRASRGCSRDGGRPQACCELGMPALIEQHIIVVHSIWQTGYLLSCMQHSLKCQPDMQPHAS